MVERIGFGIIGLSGISGIHIKAIQNMDNAYVAAVYSRDAQKIRNVSSTSKVDGFQEIQALLNHPEIDAVTICTASGYHLSHALRAARAGKHIFCEKPLEITIERGQEMIDACNQHGVKLACVFQNRFRPDYIKLQEAVNSGILGKVIHGNAIIPWYRDSLYYANSDWKGTLLGDGGGALINQGIHTIDLLQLLFGPIESVWGSVRTALHSIEGEDLGNAYVSFKDGSSATIQASTAFWPGYPERLEVYGTNGSIIYEGGFIKEWNVKGVKMKLDKKEADDHDASDPNLVDASLHQSQLEDFVKAIQEDREPIVNGEEGLKSIRIIQAIYESSRSGKVIKFQ